MDRKNGFVGVAILAVGGFIALSVVGVVVGMGMNIITIPWLRLGNRVQMERDIVKKTYNADNALYNYRWFKDRAEAIDATKTKITIAQKAVISFEKGAGARSIWTFEDKNEHARLSAVAQGLESALQEMIGEYNSRAQQADRNIFSDELPLFFSL